MKILNRWIEFGDENAPSISSSFEKRPYEGMDKIADYLDRGKVRLTSTGVGFDVLTGEQISGKYEILTDGEYSWVSTLAYYVRKYYLRLPSEFEEKVLT